jgi:hypothetical protein
MVKKAVSVLAVAAAVAMSGLFAGCEGGGGGDGGGGGGSSSFVGTWTLYSGGAASGSPAWYANFNSGGTFNISDNADGSGVRVSGTYTVTDGSLVGPFTNPGVGEGRVEATISDNLLHMNFIEYWHTPNKVVPYTGTKL